MTPLCPDLSPREEQVLVLLGEGFGLREIADQLGISYRQARRDRDDAVRASGKGSQTAAAVWVREARAEAGA